MAFKIALEIEDRVELDRRDDYVRSMWRNLYDDYLAFLDEADIRQAVDQQLTAANPDDLLTSWTFVLFKLANSDYRAGLRRDQHDFVLTMQSEGVIAYDKPRSEDVYLHTA